MIKINETLISKTSEKAKLSSRRRMNFNFHNEDSATLQRMLNAMEPDTYIQPHKHENPDKVEAFFVLRGRILVVEFDDEGNIIDIETSPKRYTYLLGENESCITPAERLHLLHNQKDNLKICESYGTNCVNMFDLNLLKENIENSKYWTKINMMFK